MDTLDYCDIIEWLYSNHEAYKNAHEWRNAFLAFLKSKVTEK